MKEKTDVPGLSVENNFPVPVEQHTMLVHSDVQPVSDKTILLKQ